MIYETEHSTTQTSLWYWEAEYRKLSDAFCRRENDPLHTDLITLDFLTECVGESKQNMSWTMRRYVFHREDKACYEIIRTDYYERPYYDEISNKRLSSEELQFILKEKEKSVVSRISSERKAAFEQTYKRITELFK